MFCRETLQCPGLARTGQGGEGCECDSGSSGGVSGGELSSSLATETLVCGGCLTMP